jgi:hypothetical protein
VNEEYEGEMFPETRRQITDLEKAEGVMEHLMAEVERRANAVESAKGKLADAYKLVEYQTDVIVELGGGTPEQIADKMRRSAIDAGMGLSFQINDEEPVVLAEVPE